MAMGRIVQLALVAIIAILAINTYCEAKLNCAHVSADGFIYNMANLTYLTVGPGYTAFDGDWRFGANICGPVSEAQCKAQDGYVCMYNKTSGAMKALLATSAPQYETPQWIPSAAGSRDGIVLSSRNGFWNLMRAIVRIELKCQPDAVPTSTLIPNLNYDLATFKFGLATPWACPIGTTSFSVSAPHPIPRTGAGSVWVTVTSLPPTDVSIQCSSPNLLISPLTVNFKGPENGIPTTFEAHVGLAQNLDLSVSWFMLSCVVTGSNASLYSFPPHVNITVAAPQPPTPPHPGHRQLSGGSIFLIIIFVIGFCYILFGVLYNWRVKGAELGWNLFPNIELWRSIWEHAKDGNAYFFGHLLRIQACRRTASSSSSSAGSYEEVH